MQLVGYIGAAEAAGVRTLSALFEDVPVAAGNQCMCKFVHLCNAIKGDFLQRTSGLMRTPDVHRHVCVVLRHPAGSSMDRSAQHHNRAAAVRRA